VAQIQKKNLFGSIQDVQDDGTGDISFESSKVISPKNKVKLADNPLGILLGFEDTFAG